MTTHAVPMTRASIMRLGWYGGMLSGVGQWAMVYALALLFLWFGALKFTAFEASGIAPLIMNSPLIGWTHGLFGIAGASKAIGVIEILAGLLIAARPVNPLASATGGVMAVITFLITLSFLLTTPGVVQPGTDSIFALSAMPGQFLLKDIVLLCVSFWVAGTSIDVALTKD